MRALSKIEQILPPRLGRRLAALQAVIVTPSRAGSPVSVRILSAIAAACRDYEALRFRYRDHAGKTSNRFIEPHRVVNTGRRWYLVAWDSERNDWRTFRVDRIQPRLTAGPRFAPRELPARDLAAYVTRGVWYAPPCRARIKLLVAAATVADRLPPGIGLIEPIDEHSCFFDAGASTFESLALHLVLLGVDFELTEPSELVDQIRRLADRYRRAAAEVSAYRKE